MEKRKLLYYNILLDNIGLLYLLGARRESGNISNHNIPLLPTKNSKDAKEFLKIGITSHGALAIAPRPFPECSENCGSFSKIM